MSGFDRDAVCRLFKVTPEQLAAIERGETPYQRIERERLKFLEEIKPWLEAFQEISVSIADVPIVKMKFGERMLEADAPR